MTSGLYAYCVGELGDRRFGRMGINQGSVYTIPYRGISAVVSDVPYKQLTPSMDTVMVHHKVVEAAREAGTVVPIRFGVVIKDRSGVEKLLKSSYSEFSSKIERFRDREEYGVKMVIEKAGFDRLRKEVERDSQEARRLKGQVEEAGEGKGYFLRMKLDDHVRSETSRKIEEMGSEAHKLLSAGAEDSKLLKTELARMILNGSYLTTRGSREKFDSALSEVRSRFSERGITVHSSGPWAPYSFC